MKAVIDPAPLGGTVRVPSSKSRGHRSLICAALAEGTSVISRISPSDDLEATAESLRQLGASIKTGKEGDGLMRAVVRGGLRRTQPAVINCRESGSTLRLLIPLGLLQKEPVTWTGTGRLPERPLAPYGDLFKKKGIQWETETGGLPLTAAGRLLPGEYSLPGGVSSQFISGLLLALPLLQGQSRITVTSPPESAAYIAMTLETMDGCGVCAEPEGDRAWMIPGGQAYRPFRTELEGDWSQGAFWMAAGLLGQPVSCRGLSVSSVQADRAVTDIIRRMGGHIEETEEGVSAFPSHLRGTVIDGSQCPDIIPVLTVLGALAEGTTQIIRAGRLRLKECDRLHAMTEELKALGASVKETEDGMVIQGRPFLNGGQGKSWGDHRVAMSLAVASVKCRRPLVLEGAGSVSKSYLRFWEDFRKLGGIMKEEGMPWAESGD